MADIHEFFFLGQHEPGARILGSLWWNSRSCSDSLENDERKKAYCKNWAQLLKEVCCNHAMTGQSYVAWEDDIFTFLCGKHLNSSWSYCTIIMICASKSFLLIRLRSKQNLVLWNTKCKVAPHQGAYERQPHMATAGWLFSTTEMGCDHSWCPHPT